MYYGLDKFREELVSKGWRIALSTDRGVYNSCNWYAWRKSKAKTDCISNEKVPSLIVYPYWSTEPMRYSSFEVEMCGEVPTGWVKLLHYSHDVPKFNEEIDNIEAALVASWEAMHTVK
jgi:hypothetical protein